MRYRCIEKVKSGVSYSCRLGSLTFLSCKKKKPNANSYPVSAENKFVYFKGDSLRGGDVAGFILGVDIDDLRGRNAIEGSRVVRPISSRTIDPDKMIRSKDIGKINSLLLAVGILPKDDVRAVTAGTIQNTRLRLLRRSRRVPLEGNLVGLVQPMESADGEKDT